MAINLTIPIGSTNVNTAFHHITGAHVSFGRNGLLVNCTVNVSSYVDNVATDPIATDTIKLTPSAAQIANMLTFLQNLLKADAKYVAGTIVADPS